MAPHCPLCRRVATTAEVALLCPVVAGGDAVAHTGWETIIDYATWSAMSQQQRDVVEENSRRLSESMAETRRRRIRNLWGLRVPQWRRDVLVELGLVEWSLVVLLENQKNYRVRYCLLQVARALRRLMKSEANRDIQREQDLENEGQRRTAREMERSADWGVWPVATDERFEERASEREQEVEREGGLVDDTYNVGRALLDARRDYAWGVDTDDMHRWLRIESQLLNSLETMAEVQRGNGTHAHWRTAWLATWRTSWEGDMMDQTARDVRGRQRERDGEGDRGDGERSRSRSRERSRDRDPAPSSPPASIVRSPSPVYDPPSPEPPQPE